ncbi:M48 family metalloprotease [Chloroflexota bacterium]
MIEPKLVLFYGASGELSLDPVRQDRARAYARRMRILSLIELIIGAGVFALLLFSGVSPIIRDALGIPLPLAGVLYFLLLVTVYTVFISPLSYYRGFIFPHRYGLMTQKLNRWLAERAKRAVLTCLLGAGLVAFIYWALGNYTHIWWVLSGVLVFLVVLVLNVVAPVVIVPFFYRCTPLDDADLSRKLMDLARRAGTEVFGIYTIDQTSRQAGVSAMLMGLGKTRRIIVSNSLFRSYSPDEIEVILAHEIGHHINRDILRLVLLQSGLVLAGFFMAFLGLKYFSVPLGFQGPSDVAALPLLIMSLAVFFLVTSPLSNAYIRRLESKADAHALQLTDNKEAFIKVMTRLANQNLFEAEPSRLAEILFYDHPPYHKRVGQAYAFRGIGEESEI